MFLVVIIKFIYILFLFFIIKLKNININSIICNKLIIISLIFELYHIV